eukprot:13556004-Alexandrium_andersonii.AAC.1
MSGPGNFPGLSHWEVGRESAQVAYAFLAWAAKVGGPFRSSLPPVCGQGAWAVERGRRRLGKEPGWGAALWRSPR